MTEDDLVAQIKELLLTFLENKDKVELWLEAPNPMFGYMEPQYLIRLGRGSKVLEAVKVAIEENNG